MLLDVDEMYNSPFSLITEICEIILYSYLL